MTLILETPGDRAAIEALREAYDCTPDSRVFMALAEQLRRRGSYGEAVDICRRAKATQPGYVSCRVLLCKCLMDMGMQEEAVREAKEVLELDRENAYCLRLMAERTSASGSHPEAAGFCRALLRINPSDLEIQQKLVQLTKVVEPLVEGETAKAGSEKAVPAAFTIRPGFQKADNGTKVQTGLPGAPPRRSHRESVLADTGDFLDRTGVVRPTVEGRARLVWHLEDSKRNRVDTAGPQPDASRSTGTAGAREESQGPAHAPEVETDTRSDEEAVDVAGAPKRAVPAIESVFFDYVNRRSDVSLFVNWVEAARRKG